MIFGRRAHLTIIPCLLLGACKSEDVVPACQAGYVRAPASNGCVPEQPACGDGQAVCAGGCTTLTSDPANCGACGTACAAGLFCSVGACSSQCAGGLTPCDSACADLLTDEVNCGVCGTVCPATQSCVGGACACAQGLQSCAGVCVDVISDAAHCGACGAACDSGQVCVEGFCGGGTSTGGAGGTGGVVGSGGAPGGGTGAAPVGGAGSSSGGSGGMGGGSVVPGQWYGAKAAQVTEAMIQSEYDAWRTRHYRECGDQGYVLKESSGQVVSEGMGYGMLLAAGAGREADFQKLYAWYAQRKKASGMLSWTWMNCNATPNDQTAATDGDLDIAMGLLQADQRWPGNGYFDAAQTISRGILDTATATCGGLLVLKPGDTWGACTGSDQRINPSYFAVGYYHVFAQKFPAQAAQWTKLRDDSYTLLLGYQTDGQAVEGAQELVPDWSAPTGAENGGGYWYDACRTPWRVATDFAWSGDARARTFLDTFQAYIDRSGGVTGSVKKDNNSAFVGSYALCGITDPAKMDAYVSAWLGFTSMDDAPYYQNSLRVIYLLLAGGYFDSTL